MTNETWAEHLFADVRHDFGIVNELYQIGHQDLSVGNPNLLSEDNTANYLFNHMKTDNEVFQRRLQTKIVFQVPVETEASKHVVTPNLSIAGNSTIGIVHDAGEFITTRIGCQNVITFGSVLDPASKPIDPVRSPIWKATPNTTIELSQYGFSPDAPGVEYIRIEGFNGVSTLVGLKFPEQEMVDGVSREVGALTRRKLINNTSIDQSGFFTSISEAKDTALQQGDDIKKRQYYYQIGKSLGDTMLVESILQMGGGGGWKTIEDKPLLGPPPSMFALKTLDRLNHVRAVLKGVPSILERKPTIKTPIVQFEYVPADITDDEFNRIIAEGVVQLRSDIASRYDEVIAGLHALLSPDGSGRLQPKYIRATGSPRAIFSGRPDDRVSKLATAGAFITEQILPRIEILKNQKLAEFDETRKPEGDRNVQLMIYNALIPFSQEITPTSSVEDERGILTHKIVLCQRPYIAIPMLNILMRIERGEEQSDFQSQFASRIGAGAGAAAASGAMVGGQVFDDSIYVDGAITLTETGRNLFNEMLDEFPIIQRFKNFTGQTEEETLRQLSRLEAHFIAEELARKDEFPMSAIEDNTKLIPLAFEDVTVLKNLFIEFNALNNLSPSQLHVEPSVVKELKETTTSNQFNQFVLNLNIQLFPEYIGREEEKDGPAEAAPSSQLSVYSVTPPDSPRAAKRPRTGDSLPGTAVGSQLPSSGSSSDVEGVVANLFRGGLRRTYRKHKNVRSSTSRVSRRAGLRRRKGTRASTRV